MNKIALGIVAGALSAVYAQQTIAAPADDTQIRQSVQFSDLDFASAGRVSALYGRLRAASRIVCQPLEDRSLERAVRYRGCVESALSDAVAQVDRPQLTRHHLSRKPGRELFAHQDVAER